VHWDLVMRPGSGRACISGDEIEHLTWRIESMVIV
jgi:hypothetical protein